MKKNNSQTTLPNNPPMSTPPVDNPEINRYTLEQITAVLAPYLPNLENQIRSHVNANSDEKGVSEMAKTYKQRVKVGVTEDKEPIYKWALGHTVEELNDNIVRLYVEYGMIDKFIHFDKALEVGRVDIPTFKEYANKWFDTYKKPKLKPTTLQGYRSNMKMHLFPAFGDMRLDDITVDTLQKFLNDRVNLAKNTVHTMFVLFSEIMDSAFEDRYIQSNPAKSRRITIPSTKKKERQALSPEQLRLIIAQISEKLTDVTERRLMALLLFTGMRRGEVMGLRWEDIDFERRLIAVNRAVSYTTNQPIISTPKTKSGKRVIPLDDQLADFLMPHLDTGYVIGGKEPPTLMVTRRLLRNLEKKIDMFGATPHVFRHSYISALAEAGVDLKTIQQISGHSNVTTTMGIYAHTRLGLVQEAGGKVAKLLQ